MFVFGLEIVFSKIEPKKGLFFLPGGVVSHHIFLSSAKKMTFHRKSSAKRYKRYIFFGFNDPAFINTKDDRRADHLISIFLNLKTFFHQALYIFRKLVTPFSL